MDEREVGRVVRSAAESVYGVVAVRGSSWLDRLARSLGFGGLGVSVKADPQLDVTVDLHIAETVPSNQVAANVAEKVRYVVERETGRAIDRLTVLVDGRPVEISPQSASGGS